MSARDDTMELLQDVGVVVGDEHEKLGVHVPSIGPKRIAAHPRRVVGVLP